ncbi:hypothetical protein RJ640_018142 [Escallonia rubra]|uniref:L domain-like protein n=1 Tax=Escallonia rubra TaxID=112253 RepID=A0AA88SFA7_9ASTE|nr:hypothetical protein RJ640_018142 [Escallonia rubra]
MKQILTHSENIKNFSDVSQHVILEAETRDADKTLTYVAQEGSRNPNGKRGRQSKKAGNDMSSIVATKKWLSSTFEMKDMGEANYVLGVKIVRDRSKRLLGRHYESDLAEKLRDLTRNYLNGSIPPEWGSMQLTNISLFGNRLTGPIPKQIGNISTLEEIVLEFNQLSGPIPSELRTLPRIERILLTSNNFSGELPETLAELTTLKDFYLTGNMLDGPMPESMKKAGDHIDLSYNNLTSVSSGANCQTQNRNCFMLEKQDMLKRN